MKKNLFSAALKHGLCLLAFSLGFMELFLYLRGYPAWRTENALSTIPVFHMPDAMLGWKNKPGNYSFSDKGRLINMTFLDNSSRVTGTLNRPAMRTGPSPLIFTGDSFTQGYGLSDQETFAWAIQIKYPERHIINVGTGGYGTLQALLSIEQFKILPRYESFSTEKTLRPDPNGNIMYLFNDFHEGRNAGAVSWRFLTSAPPAGSGFHFPFCGLDEKGQLKYFKSPGVFPWTAALWFRSAALLQEVLLGFNADKDNFKQRKITELLLKAFADDAKKANFLFTIILFQLSEVEKAQYAAFLKAENISFFDCNTPEVSDPKLRLSDGHPNAELNLKLAECISRNLENEAQPEGS